jgi:hypothetical protein
MTFLTDEFERGKITGKLGRMPHLSVWFDNNLGWRAAVAGVMCAWSEQHATPEAAITSAFNTAIYLAERNGGRKEQTRRDRGDRPSPR